MKDRAALLAELAKVDSELFSMTTTSYSQSNPYYVLGIRSLRRQKERLLSQLAALPKT